MKRRQHQTLSTVSTALWCNKCRKETQHSVSGKKIGHCLNCSSRASETQAEVPVQQIIEVEPLCTCNWAQGTKPYPHSHSRQRLSGI
jgi:hypothetical protein